MLTAPPNVPSYCELPARLCVALTGAQAARSRAMSATAKLHAASLGRFSNMRRLLSATFGDNVPARRAGIAGSVHRSTIVDAAAPSSTRPIGRRLPCGLLSTAGAIKAGSRPAPRSLFADWVLPTYCTATIMIKTLSVGAPRALTGISVLPNHVGVRSTSIRAETLSLKRSSICAGAKGSVKGTGTCSPAVTSTCSALPVAATSWRDKIVQTHGGKGKTGRIILTCCLP